MTLHIQGQRCATCKGALRWRKGSQPSHVFLQDIPSFTGIVPAHQAVREPGDPQHMWEQDTKVPYIRPPE